MFDVTLQAYTMGIIPVPDDHHLIYNFSIGVVLPSGAQGQQGLLPIGIVRIPVGHNMSTEFIKEQQEAIEKVPPPPKLQVVKDLSEAQRAAEGASAMERDLRSGGAA